MLYLYYNDKVEGFMYHNKANKRNFEKLLKNKLALKYILYDYKEYFFDYYGLIVVRDSKKKIIMLPDAESKNLQEILDSKSVLTVVSSDNTARYVGTLHHKGGKYYLNDKLIDIHQVSEYLKEDSLITEYIDFNKYKRLHVSFHQAQRDHHIDKILGEMIRAFPHFIHLTFDLLIDGNTFKIDNIHVDAPQDEKISLRSVLKKYMDRILEKYGWVGYMYRAWLKGLVEDNSYKGTTRSEKKWAHKRGFYSYRIEQYGLTENNYKEFLSDRDYKWLRHINNKYRSWMRDKVRFYYILGKYKEFLPDYYYRLSNGFVYRFDDPNSKKNIVDIVVLLKEKGKLAIKPIKSSHGIGFYKLEYTKDTFYVNDQEYQENGVITFLNNLKEDYIVTEYVHMHAMLNNIYSASTGTVRMMVINTDGNNPIIAHAYLRVGSSLSGAVDNLNRGGISVQLNHLTGEIIGAEILREHKYQTIGVHPDSGERIHGVLPHWDMVCKKIKEIALYISPIEYLGFDIVITETGFKILEVNMHQELHKYPDYSPFVKDYFEKKKTMKRSGKRIC